MTSVQLRGPAPTASLGLGLGSWLLSSWLALLSRLVGQSVGVIGRGDPVLPTDAPQSRGCLPLLWGLHSH